MLSLPEMAGFFIALALYNFCYIDGSDKWFRGLNNIILAIKK
jgi:hypothetical protein